MLSVRLQMRQSQSLVLTPQLLQSIRLLQYSHSELAAFVDGEIERNPLLERADEAAYGVDGPRPARDEPMDGGAREGGEDPSAIAADAFGGDMGMPRRGTSDEGLPALKTGAGGEGKGLALADTAAADERPSLARHALAEIADALCGAFEMKIGEALTGHLDDAGYLDCPVADVAAALGLPVAEVEAVLARIKDHVEPAGLFAQNLADCLAIQLRRRNRLDPVMQTVLDHLDLLGRRDFAALRRLTGEDEADLMDILAEIRRLDPKPGHGFDHAVSGMIAPDVIVAAAPDGTWQVELNPQALPRVLVNDSYAATIDPNRLDKDDQAFLTECQTSANWLVRALDQRARTVLKVTAEIVRRQDEFLIHGVSRLKPMTLMAVAESIGMHESTVSRVTSNKYVATPRGTFEMKFFFTVAIAATGGGESHSAESVKHRIRMMVDTETPTAVLSDDDIADRLRRDGVDLARRTVAKYREALGIPSSIQRRREMNARRLAS